MAINFNPGDFVRVNTSYVQNSLSGILPVGSPTLTILGYLGFQPSVVAAVGTVDTQSFIRVVPLNKSSVAYNDGFGVTGYFPTETTLNNSFELSTAFLPTIVATSCLNNSGSLIPKGSAVYFTGYDVSQKPTIALASAADPSTATFFGIAVQDIADAASGDVITEGSYQGLDTSAFSIAGTVYLSDTPGGISDVAGTVSVSIGQVLAVNANGAISIGLLNGGGGGGGGSAASIRSTVKPTFGSFGQYALVGSNFSGTGILPASTGSAYPILNVGTGDTPMADRYGNFLRLQAGGGGGTPVVSMIFGGPPSDEITRISQRPRMMFGFRLDFSDVTACQAFVGVSELLNQADFESNLLIGVNPTVQCMGLIVNGNAGESTWQIISVDSSGNANRVDTEVNVNQDHAILYLYIEAHGDDGEPPAITLYGAPDTDIVFGPYTPEFYPQRNTGLMHGAGLRIVTSPSFNQGTWDIFNGFIAIEPFVND